MEARESLAVVHRDELVALVRESGAALGEVRANLRLPIEDVAGGDELVAWAREGPDRHVEVEAVFRFHVLAHYGLAPLAQPVTSRTVLAHLKRAYLSLSLPLRSLSNPVVWVRPAFA